jgi:hypothetical protein
VESFEHSPFRDTMYLVGQSYQELLIHHAVEGHIVSWQTHKNYFKPCCGPYVNVPIEDPTRQGKYGRPAVLAYPVA